MQEFLPLLKVNSQYINKKVLVCGDPARAKLIADSLTDAKEISYNREYRLFNGEYAGQKISVVSHGVGAAGAAVVFEEIIKGGAKEIIRVGTAGSLDKSITDGDLVIATGAVRKDGLTDQLVDLSFPAIADYELIVKLKEAAKGLQENTQTGIVLTLGTFYPELDGLPNNYFSKAGAKAVEMEASALFVIASLHGVKAGMIAAIDGLAIDFEADSYNPHREKIAEAIKKEIDIALQALTN